MTRTARRPPALGPRFLMLWALWAGLMWFGLCAVPPAHAEEEPSAEVVAVAGEAGVEAIDLAGAVNTTGLSAAEYLYAVGELKRPVLLSGRLACIAWAESRNDPNATNRYSGAAGLFQFLPSTWRSTPQGRAGLSPYNASAATAAAQWMVAQGRIREWVPVQMGMC